MSAHAKLAACLATLGLIATIAAADEEVPAVEMPPGYEDRLIEDGALAPDVSVGESTVLNAGGWPRALHVEAITSRVTRDDVDQDESGLRLNAMLDTPNHGAISLDANLRSSHGYSYGSGTGDLYTLYQIGLPMNGDWLLNNAVGVSNTPAVDLARTQQRFWVPSILNNGSSTEWRKAGGLQLHASFGRPGLLTGIYVPTFEGLDGEQLSAGAQWNGRGRWSAALQAVDIEDVRLGIGPLNSAETRSGHALFGAVGWGDPDLRVQLNLIESAMDDQDSGTGAWLDSAVRSGRIRHTFGAFRFDPEVAWANQPLASNHQGGYYRAAFQNRQWILDGGVDYVSPVSGNADDTVFGTSYARYQWSSRLGLGGGLNVRQDDSTAWSAFGFVDHTNALGIGRAQADYATDDLREQTQLTLNQTWNVPAGMRLGSSLIVGQDEFAGREHDHGRPCRERRRRHPQQPLRRRQRPLGQRRRPRAVRQHPGEPRTQLDVRARLDSGRQLLHQPQHLACAARHHLANRPGPAVRGAAHRRRGLLHHAASSVAGRFPHRAARGRGRVGVGSGSIQGLLYLDNNDNGRMDAGEPGVPNVVIMLNGRFAARTNSEGRFEFPSVAAGAHVLSVVQDNLPLPWTVPEEGNTQIEVGVRERSFVELGARRQR